VLGRWTGIWQLVKVRVRIVGVPYDDAVFRPVHNSRFVDAEASSRFRCGQHTAVAKPVVARAKRVLMDEIGDAQRGKSSAAASSSSRSTGAKSLLSEDVGDFGIDVVVEELVDKLDDLGRRLDLLR